MKKIILITFLCLCLLVGSVSAAGTYAYVANYGSNTVSVINTSTNTVSATVTVGTGPIGVAINPAGTYVYVANNGGNTVSVINTSTNTVSATVTVGSVPYGVAIASTNPPIAISSLSRNTIQAGGYTWFNDTSQNVPTAWCWTFGDGAYAGVANGSHTYVLRGIYNVSSNVSNSAGYNISYNIERVI